MYISLEWDRVTKSEESLEPNDCEDGEMTLKMFSVGRRDGLALLSKAEGERLGLGWLTSCLLSEGDRF